MFNADEIKDALKKSIEGGNREFVIYPFGNNGLLTKNILWDYFGIKPILVVDNGWCKYNGNISSFKDFKKQYCNHMTIILTAENSDLNEELFAALVSFVPREHIMNLAFVKAGAESNYSLKNILPPHKHTHISITDSVHNKIRVRVVHPLYSTWNAIASICQAFAEDEAFDLKIIIGGDKDSRLIAQAEAGGYDHVLWDEYSAPKDEPDILIVSQPYDTVTTLPYVREYATLVVAACTLLIRNTPTHDGFWNVIRRGFGRFQPDYYLFDSLLYQDIQKSGRMQENIVEMGNAKFDGIYHATREKRYRPGWEKLQGKTVIFWTVDHGIVGGAAVRGTFDIYARTIFEYAQAHPQIGVLFRTHDRLFPELIEWGYWTRSDVDEIKRYCDTTPNVVFDDSETYDNGFSIADGILADSICGISVSALPTMKPICLTYREKDSVVFHPELAEYYYSAHVPNDIVKFIERVKDKHDPMHGARKKVCKKIVKSFDGGNGRKIKKIVEKMWRQMQRLKGE